MLVVGIAGTRRFRRRHDPTRAAASETTRRASQFGFAVAAWSTIAVVVLTWELLALGSSPRSQHPTISSLVETVEQYHVGRVALFIAWLWLGWTLVS